MFATSLPRSIICESGYAYRTQATQTGFCTQNETYCISQAKSPRPQARAVDISHAYGRCEAKESENDGSVKGETHKV